MGVANVQFLMNKEVGDTPSHKHVSIALIHESDRWFRIDAKVRDKVIVQGKVEEKRKRVVKGFKDSVDDLVYGERRAYMG
jgi:hypothetical protein